MVGTPRYSRRRQDDFDGGGGLTGDTLKPDQRTVHKWRRRTWGLGTFLSWLILVLYKTEQVIEDK